MENLSNSILFLFLCMLLMSETLLLKFIVKIGWVFYQKEE